MVWQRCLTEFVKERCAPQISLSPYFNVSTEDELLAAIGYGTSAPMAVINRLRPPDTVQPKQLTVSGTRTDETKLSVLVGRVDRKLND